jgi:hypothetical protein
MKVAMISDLTLICSGSGNRRLRAGLGHLG